MERLRLISVSKNIWVIIIILTIIYIFIKQIADATPTATEFLLIWIEAVIPVKPFWLLPQCPCSRSIIHHFTTSGSSPFVRLRPPPRPSVKWTNPSKFIHLRLNEPVLRRQEKKNETWNFLFLFLPSSAVKTDPELC